MSTAAIVEVDAKLKSEADNVLSQLGTSVNHVVDLLLSFVVERKKIPDDLKRPPISCIDDITEEELDEIFLEGIAEIKAGNFHMFDEVKKVVSVSGVVNAEGKKP